MAESSKLAPDLDLVCTDVILLVEDNQLRVKIRAELIEFPPGENFGQPNDIHLGMTREDSMRLLEHLKAAQEHYGWQELSPSVAPPSKDRQN
jgi:hypothetical protein